MERPAHDRHQESRTRFGAHVPGHKTGGRSVGRASADRISPPWKRNCRTRSVDHFGYDTSQSQFGCKGRFIEAYLDSQDSNYIWTAMTLQAIRIFSNKKALENSRCRLLNMLQSPSGLQVELRCCNFFGASSRERTASSTIRVSLFRERRRNGSRGSVVAENVDDIMPQSKRHSKGWEFPTSLAPCERHYTR